MHKSGDRLDDHFSKSSQRTLVDFFKLRVNKIRQFYRF